jgi:UDP-N-acetylglucosamine diphosphorylase/glucosamine-1-phosphate N-acetyltransferase
MKDIIAIIMAGGLGKRMESNIPKVLHNFNNKPMIVHIIEQVNYINPKKIIIVVGKFKSLIENKISEYVSLDNIIFINQPYPLGTGNAILCCRKTLYNYHNSNTIILSGDTPCISKFTLERICNSTHDINIVTTKLENPYGYGRIIHKYDKFSEILEEKDCSEELKKINYVNCGIYYLDTLLLFSYLPFINNENAQNEYYLTDIIKLIKEGELKDINEIFITKENQIEILGVNTKEQLLELENMLTTSNKNSMPFCFEEKYDISEKWL